MSPSLSSLFPRWSHLGHVLPSWKAATGSPTLTSYLKAGKKESTSFLTILVKVLRRTPAGLAGAPFPSLSQSPPVSDEVTWTDWLILGHPIKPGVE